jgi:hypothetical protein
MCFALRQPQRGPPRSGFDRRRCVMHAQQPPQPDPNPVPPPPIEIPPRPDPRPPEGPPTPAPH